MLQIIYLGIWAGEGFQKYLHWQPSIAFVFVNIGDSHFCDGSNAKYQTVYFAWLVFDV